MELRFAEGARATKDIDIGLAGERAERLRAFGIALTLGFDEFTFQRSCYMLRFKTGDRVFGTGDMTRDGAWAERVAVDHRVVARIPESLMFVDAASLPIGALTAWEAMFREQNDLPIGVERVLIVGGAGGVGSIATQLLKAETSALVISTASRPESREWCHEMGADLVIDHRQGHPGTTVSRTH
jgi:NADPH:quinone reductase-like Zn-dependent oxidoreductase